MSIYHQNEPYSRPTSTWLPEKCQLFLEQYRNWVLGNTPMARYLENALYIAPQFVPVRCVD